MTESFFIGVWRSLVARTAGGREVAGSNPVTPIFLCPKIFLRPFSPRRPQNRVLHSCDCIPALRQCDI